MQLLLVGGLKLYINLALSFSLANPSFLFKTSVAGGLETGLMAIKKQGMNKKVKMLL